MRDGNNISGRSRRSTPFYEELNAILGHRAASQPAVLLASGRDQDGEATVTMNTEPARDTSGFEDDIDEGTYWQYMYNINT